MLLNELKKIFETDRSDAFDPHGIGIEFKGGKTTGANRGKADAVVADKFKPFIYNYVVAFEPAIAPKDIKELADKDPDQLDAGLASTRVNHSEMAIHFENKIITLPEVKEVAEAVKLTAPAWYTRTMAQAKDPTTATSLKAKLQDALVDFYKGPQRQQMSQALSTYPNAVAYGQLAAKQIENFIKSKEYQAVKGGDLTELARRIELFICVIAMNESNLDNLDRIAKDQKPAEPAKKPEAKPAATPAPAAKA